MTTTATRTYDVGGVLLERPFKIRRLGHFGFNINADKMDETVNFYVNLLGFRISDVTDFSARFTNGEMDGVPVTPGYFTRHNSDHHTFVLFNKQVMERMGQLGGRQPNPQVTMNQITWQVGSLAEVGRAGQWLSEEGVILQRTGRDMPGSNWHTYVYDADGHTNELYYGIEQVGWEGFSKPRTMYHRGFRDAPALPQINEFTEVQQAMADGLDLHGGYRFIDTLPASYDVDGILLPRPFKIVRIGPVDLFVNDMDRALTFYRDKLGFVITEETTVLGERCVFLRNNTEHHSVALFPISLRERLGFSGHTTNASFGVQVANYRQLREAVRFLQEQGCRFIEGVPPALHPGIDYAAYVQDPDGHCIQLYWSMEQVGWDGQVRPREERAYVAPAGWPETVAARPDSFMGEPFLGPWS